MFMGDGLGWGTIWVKGLRKESWRLVVPGAGQNLVGS